MRIAFLAPENKGGPYFIYQDFVQELQKYYGSQHEIFFFHSKKDYFLLHFQKYDLIFSTIPFFFKPLRTKKYFYHLHGNYRTERKGNNIALKLLYLAEWNFFFSDTIILTSYYLADLLNFRKQYQEKILILPNYIKTEYPIPQHQPPHNTFMTITSFSFYPKGKGIISLIQVLVILAKKNPDQNYLFSIIGDKNGPFFSKIYQKIQKIGIPANLNLQRKGFLSQEQIHQEFQNHGTFLYRSELDNMPGVLLEALAHHKNILTNNFPSFHYFLPSSIICKTAEDMLEKIQKPLTYVKIPKDLLLTQVMKKLIIFIDSEKF